MEMRAFPPATFLYAVESSEDFLSRSTAGVIVVQGTEKRWEIKRAFDAKKLRVAKVDLGFGNGRTVPNQAEDARCVHRWWPSDSEPWGAICLIHGFGDHGGRFRTMGNTLASLGLAVLAIDLIGHGRSPGRRGVIDSYEQLLNEVRISLEFTEASWPKIPKFLFGQSMGGNLVLNWLLRKDHAEANVKNNQWASSHRLRGAIIGAPMLRTPRMPQERFMRAGRMLAEWFPNLRIHTPHQAELLTRDRIAQDAYTRDKLVHRSMSLRLATNLIDSGTWALENAHLLKTPTLLLHGSVDRLTCPKATEEFADRAGGIARFIACEGCRHDLTQEPQREWLFEMAANWAKQQCIRSWTFPANSQPTPASRKAKQSA